MLSKLAEGLRPDAIILSDYAKGVLTPEALAGVVRVRGSVPVVVDPKHADFVRYRGATTLTPNLRELEEAVGRSLKADDTAGIAGAARQLLKATGIQSMVVTLGNRGMLLVTLGGPENHSSGNPA